MVFIVNFFSEWDYLKRMIKKCYHAQTFEQYINFIIMNNNK